MLHCESKQNQSGIFAVFIFSLKETDGRKLKMNNNIPFEDSPSQTCSYTHFSAHVYPQLLLHAFLLKFKDGDDSSTVSGTTKKLEVYLGLPRFFINGVSP